MASLAAALTPSIAEEETVTVSTICLRVSGSLRKGLVLSNDFLDMNYYNTWYWSGLEETVLKAVRKAG